jgi:PTH1 family peptidyl-tRNA hydrolase
VLYDEIDLAPGKLKVKTGGGNAGHNGLRSISAHLGNDYVRVRIGVGHPGVKEAVAHYVLSDFAKADRQWLEPLLDAVASSARLLAAGDQARFMSEVARQIAPADARRPAAEDERPPPRAATAKSAGPPHPAGERASKRQSALADNLKKWLAGRKDGS